MSQINTQNEPFRAPPKPFWKKGWFIGVVLVLVILIGMGSCTGGSKDSTPQPVASSVPKSEQAESSKPAPDRNFAVTIDGFKVTKDYEGKPALVVDFTFTNNSRDAVSFLFATVDKAFQDGIQLERAIIVDGKTYDSDAAWKDIKPDKSLQVQSAYELSDTEADVEVEVKELLSFNNEPLAHGIIELS